MSIFTLYDNNIISFPNEIETNGRIKYDFSNIHLNTDIITKIKSSLADYNLISLATSNYSGLATILANSLSKELVLVNPQTGLRTNGKKYNYKQEYVLWLDNTEYNTEMLNGIIALSKKGLKISCIVSLVECNEGFEIFADSLFGNIYKPIFRLYNILSQLEAKQKINGFIVEKCKFNADKNRKLTHSIVESYNNEKNGNFEHIVKPVKWYVDNYYIHHHPENQYNNVILTYLKPIEWNKVRDELILHSNIIKTVILNINNISELDNNELAELQEKYKFRIIEYNPYNVLLNTRRNHMNIEIIDTISTSYDGLVYSLNMENWNMAIRNDLITEFNRMNSNIYLYINITEQSQLTQIRDFIIYGNEYLSNKIQAVILDYENIRNFTIPKKLYLHSLIPVIIYSNNISDDILNYVDSRKFSSIASSAINFTQPIIERINALSVNKCVIDEYIVNVSKDINLKVYYECLTKKIQTSSYSLVDKIRELEQRDMVSDSNNDSNNGTGTLLDYISPVSWYKYFMS